MKIDDMIEQLQIFKNQFGNLDILIPEVIEQSDYNSYSIHILCISGRDTEDNIYDKYY